MTEPIAYHPDRPCPKCKHDDVSTAYEAHSYGYECYVRLHHAHFPLEGDEHFHRRCRRCGHEWREEVRLDVDGSGLCSDGPGPSSPREWSDEEAAAFFAALYPADAASRDKPESGRRFLARLTAAGWRIEPPEEK